MTMEEKNKYSHRARALNKMMHFLNDVNKNKTI
jgi:inosine/xanthosine triphosphate pyrophosphatase family protein